MSSKNRKFGPPWLGGRSLSCRCLRKSRNFVGLRGDWQLVTFTRLFLSSKKKKTLMNPWVYLAQCKILTTNVIVFPGRDARRLRLGLGLGSGLGLGLRLGQRISNIVHTYIYTLQNLFQLWEVNLNVLDV